MQTDVADFMGDQQRLLADIAYTLEANRAALLIEQCACALQRRIARLEDNEFEIEMADSSVHHRRSTQRVSTRGNEFIMEATRPISNMFESVHLWAGSKLHKKVLLFLTQPGTFNRLFEALPNAGFWFLFGLVELRTRGDLRWSGEMGQDDLDRHM